MAKSAFAAVYQPRRLTRTHVAIARIQLTQHYFDRLATRPLQGLLLLPF
jgi:hypothetical protein